MKREIRNFNPDTVYNWNMNRSNHSEVRSCQRGISHDIINLALDYSVAIFKQGLIFFAVVQKMMPDNMDHHLREKLNNLVVVFSPESNEIITCYKSPNGINHIKRKPKRSLFA